VIIESQPDPEETLADLPVYVPGPDRGFYKGLFLGVGAGIVLWAIAIAIIWLYFAS
jgi:hypothetical protein